MIRVRDVHSRNGHTILIHRKPDMTHQFANGDPQQPVEQPNLPPAPIEFPVVEPEPDVPQPMEMPPDAPVEAPQPQPEPTITPQRA